MQIQFWQLQLIGPTKLGPMRLEQHGEKELPF